MDEACIDIIHTNIIMNLYESNKGFQAIREELASKEPIIHVDKDSIQWFMP